MQINAQMLERFDDSSNLDEILMQRLFRLLRSAHDTITKYRNMSKITRALKASFLRGEFENLDRDIGRCIDDLSLAVGLYSASKLSSLSAAQSVEQTGDSKMEQVPIIDNNAGILSEVAATDLGDFGDMLEQLECMESSIKCFRGTAFVNESTVTGASRCTVTAFGDKVVVLNFPLSHSRAIDSLADDEEDSELAAGAPPAKNLSSGKPVEAATGGTVVFHIDNTASMNRNNRMILTKRTLMTVIPLYLSQGHRVVVNAWSSDPDTKGKVQSRTMAPPAATIDADGEQVLAAYLEAELAAILNPRGKTDLYGSFFQLLRQCAESIESPSATAGHIQLFVLTDGNHNHLDFPLHKPSAPDEDYFGVYAANKQSGKAFGRTKAEFSVAVCESFLRGQMEALQTLLRSRSLPGLSCTFIGIGDADTAALSSLVDSLGESCRLYGITNVEHIESVFRDVTAVGASLALVLSDGSEHPLQYTYQGDDGVDSQGVFEFLSGCLALGDAAEAEKLIRADRLLLRRGDCTLELKAVPFESFVQLPRGPKYEQEAPLIVNAVSSRLEAVTRELRRVRPRPHAVSSDSFMAVFRQLVADKKVISDAKAMLFSKDMRRIRKSSVLAAASMWARELEELIGSQIESYRMNVEGEVLDGILSGGGDEGRAAGGRQMFMPSQLILDRLQNNVSCAF
jgi:hypothetical protein